MTLSIAMPTRNSMLQAVIDLMDGNGANTSFMIWQTSPVPAVDDPIQPGSTVLALIFSGAFPSFPAPATGSSTQTTYTASTTYNSGQPNMFRFLDALANTIFQGSVGLDSDPLADLQFETIDWLVDSNVNITTFTISVPESCA